MDIGTVQIEVVAIIVIISGRKLSTVVIAQTVPCKSFGVSRMVKHNGDC